MIVGNAVLIGGTNTSCFLTITTAPGANITAVLDDQIISAIADDSGVAVLKIRKEGIWTITATDGTDTKSITVEVINKKTEYMTFFPSEPSTYDLIDTYTTEQTWTAPEDGYYEIELQGASGKGGTGATNQKRDTANDEVTFYAYSGGSGGGGGCAISHVKMNKGDTVVLIPGAVGSVSRATINSSLEAYDVMEVTSAGNGGNATTSAAGSAGSGGAASGGNYANYAGGAGKKGSAKEDARVLSVLEDNLMSITVTASSPAGGTAGYGDGNVGGKGASATVGSTSGSYSPSLGTPGAGSAGFVKIYRGDTNDDVSNPEGDGTVVEEPTDFSLVGTYTSSSEFVSAENGYFLVELQGASGCGGTNGGSETCYISGAGGGGGGCAISKVKMNVGDKITYTLGTATSTIGGNSGDSTATIDSSVESYDVLKVTGAANAGRMISTTNNPGTGGAGGVGSGGNYANYSGGKGGDGDLTSFEANTCYTASGAGGAAGYTGGNKGGKGESWTADGASGNNNESGSNAFIKIYRGNTNTV